MGKYTNLNGFWKVVRKWQVLATAILFVRRVSFWREGGPPSRTSKCTSFCFVLWEGLPEEESQQTWPHFPLCWWGEPVSPSPFAARAETQGWSHWVTGNGNLPGVVTKDAETVQRSCLGPELQRYPTWAVSQVWSSSLEFNFLVPAHFLTLPVQLSVTCVITGIFPIEFRLLRLIQVLLFWRTLACYIGQHVT